MKFIHMADMHFDKPFTTLNRIENLGEQRRLEQREVFRKIIQIIKEKEIPYFFIAGDLYEQEYVKLSTIEFINKQFEEIPNTQVFITPGNHDPYLANSYYATFKWAKNVHIFKDNIEKISIGEKIDIYGYGFTDFYCKNSPIPNMQIQNSSAINVLITHASLDATEGEEISYQPINTNILKKLEFNYIALGHIHKRSSIENNAIIYPGSPVAGGFDELGEHGVILGEIQKENLKLEFIPLDEREFIEKELNMENIFSLEELVEEINKLELKEKKLYKIILIGKRNFTIEKEKLMQFIQKKEIIKIKDKTKINYNLEKLENEETLKGLFIQNMKKELMQNPEKKEFIEKAIELGLEALEG